MTVQVRWIDPVDHNRTKVGVVMQLYPIVLETSEGPVAVPIRWIL